MSHQPQIWLTRDGTRQMEVILLDSKHVLKVTDPRTTMQLPDVLAWIPLQVIRMGDGRVLFSQLTTGELRKRGIELDQLVRAS